MKQTFICQRCGYNNYTGQQFCTGCGDKIQYNCPNCGVVIDPTCYNCPNCHNKLIWPNQQQLIAWSKKGLYSENHEDLEQINIEYKRKEKSKTTAFLLAIFLGPLGIHYFYLNRPGIGILYIVIFMILIAFRLPYLIYILIIIDLFLTSKRVDAYNDILAKTSIEDFEKREITAEENKAKTEAKTKLLEAIQQGNLPQIQANILMQKGEIAHLECSCRLLEEVSHREYVGGSSGFSFRITKGVYYRVGSYSGHPVTTTEMAKVDEGNLVITNQRIVFTGKRKSLVIPYKKLIGFNLFSDAIQFNTANKTKPQYFAINDPDIIAAITNMAAQKSMV